MLDAASSYAERGRMSVVEFFADMMRRQYGFQMRIAFEVFLNDPQFRK